MEKEEVNDGSNSNGSGGGLLRSDTTTSITLAVSIIAVLLVLVLIIHLVARQQKALAGKAAASEVATSQLGNPYLTKSEEPFGMYFGGDDSAFDTLANFPHGQRLSSSGAPKWKWMSSSVKKVQTDSKTKSTFGLKKSRLQSHQVSGGSDYEWDMTAQDIDLGADVPQEHFKSGAMMSEMQRLMEMKASQLRMMDSKAESDAARGTPQDILKSVTADAIPENEELEPTVPENHGKDTSTQDVSDNLEPAALAVEEVSDNLEPAVLAVSHLNFSNPSPERGPIVEPGTVPVAQAQRDVNKSPGQVKLAHRSPRLQVPLISSSIDVDVGWHIARFENLSVYGRMSDESDGTYSQSAMNEMEILENTYGPLQDASSVANPVDKVSKVRSANPTVASSLGDSDELYATLAARNPADRQYEIPAHLKSNDSSGNEGGEEAIYPASTSASIRDPKLTTNESRVSDGSSVDMDLLEKLRGGSFHRAQIPDGEFEMFERVTGPPQGLDYDPPYAVIPSRPESLVQGRRMESHSSDASSSLYAKVLDEPERFIPRVSNPVSEVDMELFAKFRGGSKAEAPATNSGNIPRKVEELVTSPVPEDLDWTLGYIEHPLSGRITSPFSPDRVMAAGGDFKASALDGTNESSGSA